MRTLAHIDWPTGYFAVLHHYSCCITRQIIQSLFVSPVLSRMAYGYPALIAGCTANLKTARRAGLASPYFAADIRRVADADSRRRQAIGLHCTLIGVVDRPQDYRRPSFPCGRCAKIRGRRMWRYHCHCQFSGAWRQNCLPDGLAQCDNFCTDWLPSLRYIVFFLLRDLDVACHLLMTI